MSMVKFLKYLHVKNITEEKSDPSLILENIFPQFNKLKNDVFLSVWD